MNIHFKSSNTLRHRLEIKLWFTDNTVYKIDLPAAGDGDIHTVVGRDTQVVKEILTRCDGAAGGQWEVHPVNLLVNDANTLVIHLESVRDPWTYALRRAALMASEEDSDGND